jgi:serine protease AprX
LNADPQFTGKSITIAFLDSGFYPHPDLAGRIRFYKDLAGEHALLDKNDPIESWQWHGTQTSVVAAGNGIYSGLAHESQLVLVNVS